MYVCLGCTQTRLFFGSLYATRALAASAGQLDSDFAFEWHVRASFALRFEMDLRRYCPLELPSSV